MISLDSLLLVLLESVYQAGWVTNPSWAFLLLTLLWGTAETLLLGSTDTRISCAVEAIQGECITVNSI